MQIADGNTTQEPSRDLTAGTRHFRSKSRGRTDQRRAALLLLVLFLPTLGRLSPAGDHIPPTTAGDHRPSAHQSMVNQINPPGGYRTPVSFGTIGPQLLAAGAIDEDRFVHLYAQADRPLTTEHLTVLRLGSDAPVVIDRENAYFLLNFFWAFGLTNRNPLLAEGPLMQHSDGQIGRFASTGGWTLGSKPVTALYASRQIITLTKEQQARLETVASAVYRPCCNNPTAFPDCNHGMALLGLLELMAAQGASIEEMFEAARYTNAFWFPQQTLEVALFLKATQQLDFAEVDARQVVGANLSSGAGFQRVHDWLAANGLLEQGPNQGGSCDV